MLAALPVVCFLLLGSLFRTNRGARAPFGRRTAFLKAAVVLGLLVWFGTEFLSLLGAVGRGGLAAYWALACAAAASLWAARRRGRGPGAPPVPPSADARGAGSAGPARVRLARLGGLDAPGWAMLGCVALIIALAGLTAFVAPPNTWDAMTYHMSRVAHWLQDRSVRFYPTNIPRQNYLAPFAEFGILHLCALWGGDRLANLVQWLCMAGSLAGVSLIAARLGAGTRGQALAALICATIPMGVLQSSSTQTDYVAAFWLVAFAALILPLIRGESGRRSDYLLAGGALGLALLTKGTAYLYAFPFLLWLIAARFRKQRRAAFGCLLLAALPALAVNLPHYARNCRLTGSPLGLDRETVGDWSYANASFGPKALASNVLRNIGLQCSAPWPWLNSLGCRAIVAVHAALGMDVNDPRTTWPGTAFGPPGRPTHEDTAGNPIHLLVMAFAFCWLLAAKPLRSSAPLLTYALCVLAGFLLFCFCLKWQPWNSRLQLPLFVLASAFAARAFPERRARWAAALVGLVLLAYAAWPLLRNESRPLVGRENIFNVDRLSLRFANQPRLERPYLLATGYVKEKGYRNIGLFLGGDDWEYPFWALLGAPWSGVRIEQAGVSGASARLDRGFGPAGPDAVICVTTKPIFGLTLGSGAYVLAGSRPPVSVLVRAPKGAVP